MPKLKNMLMDVRKILLFVFICTTSNISLADTTPILPQSGIISDVSDKLEISIENSQIILELPYIYIPPDLFPDSLKKIKELTIHKDFYFAFADDKPNRHGNFNAVITSKGDKESLQEILLENGLALAYFIENTKNNKIIFNAEQKARNSKKGIWQHTNTLKSSAIINDYKEDLGEFAIVEGKPKHIYISKKNTFINFGDDWKTDFSIEFENKLLKKSTDFSAKDLIGKTIRVRGWLEDYNGPFMKIFTVANVEIIGDK